MPLPEPGTYHRVLRDQSGLDPAIEALVTGYDEQVPTHDVTHPDGVRARTVFVSSLHFADRLRRLGWLDVSEMWVQAAAQSSAATAAAVERRTRRREPPTLEG